jgi:hypothetical protein
MDKITTSHSCSFGGCGTSLVGVVSLTQSLWITLIMLIKKIIIQKKAQEIEKKLHIYFYFIVVA